MKKSMYVLAIIMLSVGYASAQEQPRPSRPTKLEQVPPVGVRIPISVTTPSGEPMTVTVTCHRGDPLCEGELRVGNRSYPVYYPAPLNDQRLAAGGEWRYSYAMPGPEGPVVHCEGDGWGCKVAALAVARKLTPVHDATLAEATARINRLLDQVREKAPSRDHRLCFYLSQSGPLLVWAKTGSTRPVREQERITDPARIDALLRVKARGAQRNLKLVNDLPSPPGAGVYWDCTAPGSGCVVGAASTDRLTPVHNQTLAQATQEINNILSEYSQKREVIVAGRKAVYTFRPCLVTTAAGLFLAWVRTE